MSRMHVKRKGKECTISCTLLRAGIAQLAERRCAMFVPVEQPFTSPGPTVTCRIGTAPCDCRCRGASGEVARGRCTDAKSVRYECPWTPSPRQTGHQVQPSDELSSRYWVLRSPGEGDAVHGEARVRVDSDRDTSLRITWVLRQMTSKSQLDSESSLHPLPFWFGISLGLGVPPD
jgi:hypothetical protein